jgi:hypothetical protein
VEGGMGQDIDLGDKKNGIGDILMEEIVYRI